MRLALAVVKAVGPRPRLWLTTVRVAGRTARAEWWRKPPFVPLPTADYVRFRMLTNYGDPAAVPTTADIVHYLAWCRAFPRARP